MINEITRKKVMDLYGIDVMGDVFLADDYHIVFCFDFMKNVDAEIHILSGDMSAFGFPKNTSFFVKDILPYICMVNPVSEVIGSENYIEYLFSKIRSADEISEMYFPINSNGFCVWVACSIHTLKKDNETRLIYGRVNWMSQSMPDAIKYYVSKYKDSMTGLFSREALNYHLSNTRSTDHSYGLYFDIDNLKRINDIFGHRLGDKYLLDLSKKFLSRWEEDVLYYRVGGDEFFIYLVNSTEEQAYRKALQIIYDVEKLNAEGQQAEVSASVGIVPIIGSGFDVGDLMDLADRTMYHAKGKGKGNISYARDV